MIACIKQFISISRFLSNRSLKPKHPCCLNTSICNNKMAKGVDYFLFIKMFLRCDPYDHVHDPDYFDYCCVFWSFCLGQIHFPSKISHLILMLVTGRQTDRQTDSQTDKLNISYYK